MARPTNVSISPHHAPFWTANRTLVVVVLISGISTLMSEMAASRLLAPYFGTSLQVWANVIGLVLVFISLGNWLGGRLADRYPTRTALYSVTATAGVAIGLMPFYGRPMLDFFSVGPLAPALGVLGGSLAAAATLYAVPIILLGCVAPWAVRLAVADVREAGRVAGRLYAVSTVGSLLGSYLPVLLLLPQIGTTMTFLVASAAQVGVSVIGILLERRRSADSGVPAGRGLLAADGSAGRGLATR